MAELVFFSGTMNCGKSTLALQVDDNHRASGLGGVLFSCHDRAGSGVITSRLGLRTDAVEVGADLDFWDEVAYRRTHGELVDYLICDEAQFYSPGQIEQLARLVDEMAVDVFAFGFMTDFRTRLFAGSARLIELADRVQLLPVEALCWCGRRATHNARTVDGVMVVEGDQLVVEDVATAPGVAGQQGPGHETHKDVRGSGPQVLAGQEILSGAGLDELAAAVQDTAEPVVGYETLCRRHHMRRMTAHHAGALAAQPQLPFGMDVYPVTPWAAKR